MKNLYIFLILGIICLVWCIRKRAIDSGLILRKDLKNHQIAFDHLIPKQIPAKEKSSHEGQQKIPKRIYQTWKTNHVSKNHYDAIISWSKMNPGYDYFFYDDADCRQFLKQYYPKKILECYDSLKAGAYKADLFRYCLLYQFGGVYIDCSHICRTKLDEILSPDDEFVSCKDINLPKCFGKYLHAPEDIFNAFICCTAKHPFLKKAIEMAVNKISRKQKESNIFAITGPALLGQAINLCLNRDPHYRHQIGKYQINNYKIKLFRHPLLYFLFLNRRVIQDYNSNQIITEVYPNYSLEKSIVTGPSYVNLSFNNQVYH